LGGVLSFMCCAVSYLTSEYLVVDEGDGSSLIIYIYIVSYLTSEYLVVDEGDGPSLIIYIYIVYLRKKESLINILIN
jgi:hypothetical protein